MVKFDIVVECNFEQTVSCLNPIQRDGLQTSLFKGKLYGIHRACKCNAKNKELTKLFGLKYFLVFLPNLRSTFNITILPHGKKFTDR
jgi:hypothetical protein